MRISDWSSDVCSSDLPFRDHASKRHRGREDRGSEADGEVLPGEPNGLEVGMRVVVHAQDYGKDPITGTLAAASDQAITIRRTDPRVGEVTVSFPRMGFAVDRA